ncbi:hypothetical protein DFH08DRAFT_826338 [Mycena albidolilacea]|uniref:Uncharacterized protein n=1 Tax=Mycena albidolilacea TaxID=1033008 RepID=A0AAD7E8H4_9AGAR|nr:hypothetical protein DFH08DRAFT_826338 [Mycena albidolilacea]
MLAIFHMEIVAVGSRSWREWLALRARRAGWFRVFCLVLRGLGLHSPLRTFFFFAFPFIRLTFTVASVLGPRKRATWLEAMMDLPTETSEDQQHHVVRAHTDVLVYLDSLYLDILCPYNSAPSRTSDGRQTNRLSGSAVSSVRGFRVKPQLLQITSRWCGESRWFKPDAVKINQLSCMELPFGMWKE